MKHRGERTRRNVAIVLLALLLMTCGRSTALDKEFFRVAHAAAQAGYDAVD